jgi:hypothetical protein
MCPDQRTLVRCPAHRSGQHLGARRGSSVGNLRSMEVAEHIMFSEIARQRSSPWPAPTWKLPYQTVLARRSQNSLPTWAGRACTLWLEWLRGADEAGRDRGDDPAPGGMGCG